MGGGLLGGVILVVAGVVWGCGDAPAEPDPGPVVPLWLSLTPDTVVLESLGERARVHARVRPEPPGGVEVRWRSTDTAVVTVDGTGELTAVSNGRAHVIAEVGGLADTVEVRMRQVVAVLEVLGGGQRAPAGLLLRERVGVRPLDAGGSRYVRPLPVPDILFEVSAGGGRVEPERVLALGGREVWTEWTLGPALGRQTLVARVRGRWPPLTQEIVAEAVDPTEAVAAMVEVLGGGQSALPGEALGDPVEVQLIDGRGYRVAGALVRFEPLAGHGRADPAEVRSDGLGRAAAVWTLGGVRGVQTLVAVSGSQRLEIGAEAVSDEGVCARTPAVADEIVRRVGAAGCAEVTPAQLAEIRHLSLDGRGIGSLKSGDFAGLVSLRGLELERNRLVSLPPDLFRGLASLRALSLDRNRLASLPPDLFAGLGALWDLRLKGNELKSLPPGIFAGLSQLRRLRLNVNELASLPPGVFEGLADLEVLSLSANPLGTLAPDLFRGLVNLYDLSLLQVGLTELPAGIFDGLGHLRRLDLDENELRSLPPGLFRDTRRLWRVTLDDNELRSLPPGIFGGLEELLRLDISGNSLGTLPDGVFDGLGGLVRLGLELNGLVSLPPGAFADLASLRELDLGGNRLTELEPGVFAGLGRLEYLDLTTNTLESLPPRVFVGLHRLERVYLRRWPPGDPYPVPVSLARTDAAELVAPGPAQVVMRVPDGAPFPLRMPVVVQGGAGSAGWFEVGAGDTVSAPLAVSGPAGAAGPVHVSFGAPPPPTEKHLGLEVVPGAQMALFAEADNRAPRPAEPVAPQWLQAGGAAAPVPLAPHFTDPDGDGLGYSAETGDGGVVRARIEDGVLWLEPVAEGEAVVGVAAADPGGLAASQRLAVAVAPAPDPDRFDIEVIFRPGFPERYKAAARRAADRWEEVVVGDLPDVPVDGRFCSVNPGPRLFGVVDDCLPRHLHRRCDVAFVVRTVDPRRAPCRGRRDQARVIDRGLFSCLAAVPDTNDHRCIAIDPVSQHVGSGPEPHDEFTAISAVSEPATEFRQLLKPAHAIQDDAYGACRNGGILPDQKVMELLDIGKGFGQPQEARQSPAFPATAFANAFSRTVASS